MPAYYDNIALQYQEVVRQLPLYFSKIYTYLNLVGDVTGKSVLELGCGEGFYTRRLKQNGASKVLGIDISKKMIELAKEQEMREPLGIEYRVSDVLTLDKIGEFDLVVAFFLLNHAQTKAQLVKMCQNASIHLKQNGYFVALNNNLELSPDAYFRLEKYGRRQSLPSSSLHEGMPITVTLFNEFDGTECSFTDYYLSKTTYEWALQQVGFKEIWWHKPLLSPKDIQRFGEDFCRDFIEYPHLIGIKCAL
ncbi:MAG: class I SAM-dependent methyltransferase [Thioploca sp.]|nr:class I SAM-dependent methyltransferase [Thioploca sp.]